MSRPLIRILPDAKALARAAVEEVVARAHQSVLERGAFRVALAGGSTPRRAYALLAGEAGSSVQWRHVHVFWGDERLVPPGHPDSNFRMASETLLAKVAIPAANVHRIPAEAGTAAEVAERYESELRAAFDLVPGELPRFDLVLLGMGADGHTASLFPGSPALSERHRLVVAAWVPSLSTHRVTLTLPVINDARHVALMVEGDDKAQVVKDVLHGERRPALLPAQGVEPTDGTLTWLLDRPAARLLRETDLGPWDMREC